MRKSRIDPTTAKWAKQHNIIINESSDGRFYATLWDDYDTMEFAETPREAFSKVLKKLNKEPEIPPAPKEKVIRKQETTTKLPDKKILPRYSSGVPMRTRVSKGSTTGVTSEIKRIVYQLPEASPQEILSILKKRQFISNERSIMTIAAGFKNSMAILDEMGALVKPLPKFIDELDTEDDPNV